MLDQPPISAASLTLGDAVTWLGGVLIAVLSWVARGLVRRVDGHDEAISELRLQANSSERQHGETGRLLDRLMKQLDALDAKVDRLPHEIVTLLTTRRQQ